MTKQLFLHIAHFSQIIGGFFVTEGNEYTTNHAQPVMNGREFLWCCCRLGFVIVFVVPILVIDWQNDGLFEPADPDLFAANKIQFIMSDL